MTVTELMRHLSRYDGDKRVQVQDADGIVFFPQAVCADIIHDETPDEFVVVIS